MILDQHFIFVATPLPKWVTGKMVVTLGEYIRDNYHTVKEYFADTRYTQLKCVDLMSGEGAITPQMSLLTKIHTIGYEISEKRYKSALERFKNISNVSVKHSDIFSRGFIRNELLPLRGKVYAVVMNPAYESIVAALAIAREMLYINGIIIFVAPTIYFDTVIKRERWLQISKLKFLAEYRLGKVNWNGNIKNQKNMTPDSIFVMKNTIKIDPTMGHWTQNYREEHENR